MAAVDILFNKLPAVAEKGLAVKLNTPAVCPLWDLNSQIGDADGEQVKISEDQRHFNSEALNVANANNQHDWPPGLWGGGGFAKRGREVELP